MKKAIAAFGMLLMTSPAMAGGLVTKHSSSVQLNVDAARSTATRIGSSFSISGSNIDTTDGNTAGTVSVGTITSGVYNPGTIAATQDTAGAAFSFSQSYTQADAVPTSASTVGAIPNFGSVTSYTAGTAGTLAGTVTSAGVLTVTAGGAGTSGVGQFVSEVTVID
ncbi:OMP1 protein [Synechococcus phage S-CAM1]|uniref:OMP1 protein n=1 Tax=Synechococcus phage S-CAM1 TaxID=754037 RepID=A0A1D8KFM9_9CAUD|nr:OMP1 protein [Synechococcus phage S-CAM1]